MIRQQLWEPMATVDSALKHADSSSTVPGCFSVSAGGCTEAPVTKCSPCLPAADPIQLYVCASGNVLTSTVLSPCLHCAVALCRRTWACHSSTCWVTQTRWQSTQAAPVPLSTCRT